MLLYLLIVLGVCVTSVISEQKERVASLIVLPPIVLGYDELYDDLNAKKPNKEPENPKEIIKKPNPARTGKLVGVHDDDDNKNEPEKPKEIKGMNVPWEQLVTYDDPTGEGAIIIPQQRLVLKRTKNGKILVPDKEWNVQPKERTSRVKNLIRTLPQNETLKDDAINNDQIDKNETSAKAEKDTKLGIDIGKEELKKEIPIVEKEVIGKEIPSHENNKNDKIHDLSNKHDHDKNDKIKDIIKLEPNNKVNLEDVVAEKITDIITPVVINKNNENGEEEAPINVLHKKKKPMHIFLPGKGVISDPLSGDILNFHGNFILPNKLFDFPCAKNKS